MLRNFFIFLFFLISFSAKSSENYERNLNDCLDIKYGVGNWSQRTNIGIGTDVTPAIIDCLNDLRAKVGRGVLKVPPGSWMMNSGIPKTVLSGHRIEGVGSQASIFIYNSFYGAAFWWNGDQGYTGGGMKGIGILLESGLGNTNAYGIILDGDLIFQADQIAFEDIYMTSISGSSFWWDNININGSLRTSPQGIRIGTLKNIQLFNSRNLSLYFNNAVGWTLENVGTYTGIGSYANKTLIVNSTQIRSIGLWSTPVVTNSTNINLN